MATIPPLSSFSALCIEIADWLDRPSANDGTNPDVVLNRPTLGPVAPTLIALAEAAMRRQIDVRQMTNTISITLDTNGGFDLPTDFAGLEALSLTGARFPQMKGVGLNALGEMNARQFQWQGLPAYYAVNGSRLSFSPSQSFAMGTPIAGSMTYRRSIPPLSAVNPSNWLLAAHPDAYLYGSLAASAPYVKDDERISVWGGLFEAAIDAINTEGMRQAAPAVYRMRAGMIV